MGDEPVRGLGRFRGGREDGLLVALEDFQPGGDVLRMVDARLRRYGEVAAQERRAKFGDKFLDGVGFVAEACAEIPVKPMLCARPMDVMPISA